MMNHLFYKLFIITNWGNKYKRRNGCIVTSQGFCICNETKIGREMERRKPLFYSYLPTISQSLFCFHTISYAENKKIW